MLRSVRRNPRELLNCAHQMLNTAAILLDFVVLVLFMLRLQPVQPADAFIAERSVLFPANLLAKFKASLCMYPCFGKSTNPLVHPRNTAYQCTRLPVRYVFTPFAHLP